MKKVVRLKPDQPDQWRRTCFHIKQDRTVILCRSMLLLNTPQHTSVRSSTYLLAFKALEKRPFVLPHPHNPQIVMDHISPPFAQATTGAGWWSQLKRQILGVRSSGILATCQATQVGAVQPSHPDFSLKVFNIQTHTIGLRGYRLGRWPALSSVSSLCSQRLLYTKLQRLWRLGLVSYQHRPQLCQMTGLLTPDRGIG